VDSTTVAQTIHCSREGTLAAACTSISQPVTWIAVDRPYQAIAETLVHENVHANFPTMMTEYWARLAGSMFASGLSAADAAVVRASHGGADPGCGCVLGNLFQR